MAQQAYSVDSQDSSMPSDVPDAASIPALARAEASAMAATELVSLQ